MCKNSYSAVIWNRIFGKNLTINAEKRLTFQNDFHSDEEREYADNNLNKYVQARFIYTVKLNFKGTYSNNLLKN